jgi:hypothetical protein
MVANRLADLNNAPDPKRTSTERAIALADMYANIKPEEYILPLNAMAGFCRPCDK